MTHLTKKTFITQRSLRKIQCQIDAYLTYVGISGSPCFGQAYINLGSRDDSVPRCFLLREDRSGAISRGTPVTKES